jgi:hypothetical protein
MTLHIITKLTLNTGGIIYNDNTFKDFTYNDLTYNKTYTLYMGDIVYNDNT